MNSKCRNWASTRIVALTIYAKYLNECTHEYTHEYTYKYPYGIYVYTYIDQLKQLNIIWILHWVSECLEWVPTGQAAKLQPSQTQTQTHSRTTPNGSSSCRRPAPKRRGAATNNETGRGYCRPPVGAGSDASPSPSPSGNRPNHSATAAATELRPRRRRSGRAWTLLEWRQMGIN